MTYRLSPFSTQLRTDFHRSLQVPVKLEVVPIVSSVVGSTVVGVLQPAAHARRLRRPRRRYLTHTHHDVTLSYVHRIIAKSSLSNKSDCNTHMCSTRVPCRLPRPDHSYVLLHGRSSTHGRACTRIARAPRNPQLQTYISVSLRHMIVAKNCAFRTN